MMPRRRGPCEGACAARRQARDWALLSVERQERLTGLGQDKEEKEHFHGKTAELTPLGRKLLGLDRWEA